ncbi:hypothetical protein J6590_062182 [Homalodisca vitripennis]|nr:hypothetical protein J6590_062182 [Homalodisca vitripennis]
MRLFPAIHCSLLALYWILAEGFIRELNLTLTLALYLLCAYASGLNLPAVYIPGSPAALVLATYLPLCWSFHQMNRTPPKAE